MARQHISQTANGTGMVASGQLRKWKELHERILAAAESNPAMTNVELAKIVECSSETVRRHLRNTSRNVKRRIAAQAANSWRIKPSGPVTTVQMETGGKSPEEY